MWALVCRWGFGIDMGPHAFGAKAGLRAGSVSLRLG